MPVRKPILKVWCLPAMPEEELVALHKDLVAAAVSIEELNLKGEEDLLVLFPADLMKHGLGSEIFVEYDDPADWQRYVEREQLAAKLGNAVKKHLLNAFIQCEVRFGGGKARNHWNSEQSAHRKEVEQLQAAGVKLLPKFRQIAGKNCYCVANNMDFKGLCHHCNEAAAYRYVVEEGARVLDLKDPDEFQAAADIYVKMCRSDTYYEDLHCEIGWKKRSTKEGASAA